MKRRTRAKPAAASQRAEHELFPLEWPVRPAPSASNDALHALGADDELEPWDGRRIVRSLMREAALGSEQAGQIATRIEQQIRATPLRAVPTSLVRELCAAELVALGLSGERMRHARLGISMAGVGRVLRGIKGGGFAASASPADSARALGDRIKRDYALAAVLSAPVAEAHRRGRLHVGGLEAVDRPERLLLDPSSWKPGSARELARMVEDFAAVVGARLEIELPASIPDLAGILAELGDSAPRVRARAGTEMVVALSLEPGPAGDAALAAVAGNTTTDVVLVIGPEFFRAPGHRDRIERAAHSARQRGVPAFRFARAASARTPAWLSSVFLNLPRLAYEANGDEETMEARLLALLDLSARAHIERRVFLEDLLARGSRGPLGRLTANGRGRQLLRVEDAGHALVVTGVAEMAVAMTGHALHESAVARAAAVRFLTRAARHVDALGRKHKLRLVLAGTADSAVATRLARLDLRDHAGAAAVTLGAGAGAGADAAQSLSYTPGCRLARSAALLPALKRLRWEGELCGVVPEGTRTLLPMALCGDSALETARLLMQAWLRTGVRELAIEAVR